MPEQNLAKFCAGCGHPVALNFLYKALERNQVVDKAVLGLDIGCSLLAWNFLPINTFQTHHGRVTPTVMGYKRARPDSVCVGYTGDGGAYSIGLQSLLHAARRDEPITILVINNTVYGMTGGQTAPTTLHGQKTDTDPTGYEGEPMMGAELVKAVARDGAFVARTAVNEVKQLADYLDQALAAQKAGHFSLVEVLSYCPTNWKTKGIETNNYLNDKLKPVFKMGLL